VDPEVSQLKFDRDAAEVEALAADFGWTVCHKVYPLLEVLVVHPKSGRRVGMRLGCEHWDAEPPSFTMIDPDSRAEFLWDKWPQGWPVGNPHPVTGRPFLCLPGVREYHTHSSHLDDKWEKYRAGGRYKLSDIVVRIKQRFGDSHG
jgi:hypothetical protein